MVPLKMSMNGPWANGERNMRGIEEEKEPHTLRAMHKMQFARVNRLSARGEIANLYFMRAICMCVCVYYRCYAHIVQQIMQ